MRYVVVTLALTLLTGCVTDDGYMIPVPVGGGNGGSYSAPANAPQTAPQQVPVKPLPIEASPSSSLVQETHGVVNRQNCYDMETKFLRQGRRIKLVRVEQSTNPGATLQYICIFEGEDAEQGYFEDKRY